jgi:cyclic lactone autoinducer peptide
MKRLLGSVVVALLTVLAMSNLAMACNWFWYQPEVPQSLRK